MIRRRAAEGPHERAHRPDLARVGVENRQVVAALHDQEIGPKGQIRSRSRACRDQFAKRQRPGLALEDQRATVKALGLGKMNSFTVQEDTPAIKGMVRKVEHLVTVEEVQD